MSHSFLIIVCFRDLTTNQVIGKGHTSDDLHIFNKWEPRFGAYSYGVFPFEAYHRRSDPSLPTLKSSQVSECFFLDNKSCEFVKHCCTSVGPRLIS